MCMDGRYRLGWSAGDFRCGGAISGQERGVAIVRWGGKRGVVSWTIEEAPAGQSAGTERVVIVAEARQQRQE